MIDPATIRRATRDDVPAMVDILRDWSLDTPWGEWPDTRESVIVGFLKVFDDREIWVVGEPVMAYMSLNPKTAYVGALYTREQGKGIGKALLDIAKQGRDFVTLNTHVLNTDAHRFYNREGFVEVGQHDPEPPFTLREMRMEWRGDHA